MQDYSVSGTLRKKDFKQKFCRCVYSITLLSFEISDKKQSKSDKASNESKKEKASVLSP